MKKDKQANLFVPSLSGFPNLRKSVIDRSSLKIDNHGRIKVTGSYVKRYRQALALTVTTAVP